LNATSGDIFEAFDIIPLKLYRSPVIGRVEITEWHFWMPIKRRSVKIAPRSCLDPPPNSPVNLIGVLEIADQVFGR
jgi:hypothetical protein